MKRKSRLKIHITDENRLTDVASFRLGGWRQVAIAAAVVLLLMALGVVLVVITPLRRLMPGYMAPGERIRTEETMMRIDSLAEADAQTRRYLQNILNVTDPGRNALTDSLRASGGTMRHRADTLTGPSDTERRFVSMMREREKFNIAVLAPLAAEGMMFYPLAEDGIISSQSMESYRAEYIVPEGSPVCAISDGTVISVSRLKGDGHEVIVQHAKGFLSRTDGVRTPLVEVGSQVTGGQVIGLLPTGVSRTGLTLEIWHDGDPVIPSEILGSTILLNVEPSTLSGEPMGR